MSNPALSADTSIATQDKDWVRRSFLLGVNRWNPRKGTLKQENKEWLYFTTANYKFSNTSVGGNYTINNIAQFTRFADIPRGGLTSDELKNTPATDSSMAGGMGRYYSEAIDDWSMKVSFRFGMPEYKGLLTFFTGFYDGGAAILGRQGRLSRGLFYNSARIITSVVALPFTVLVWVGEVVRWMAARPSTRYYNLKPAMALYWQRVNLIANMLAANMGLTPRNFTNDLSLAAKMNEYDPRDADSQMRGAYAYDAFRKQFPKMFMPQGGIDIYHLSNKFSRMQYARTEHIKKMLESSGNNWTRVLKDQIDKHIKTADFRDPIEPGKGLHEYLKTYHQTRLGAMSLTDGTTEIDLAGNDPITKRVMKGINSTADGTRLGQGTQLNSVPQGEGGGLSEGAGGGVDNAVQNEGGEQMVADSADDGLIFRILKESEKTDTDGSPILEAIGGWLEGFKEYSMNRVKEGGQWINFRVDAVKTVDESFANNVGPSEIEGKINSMSSSAQALRFSFSDFQTGFAPVDQIVNGIRDTFMGVADGLHISGLAALMGGGYVDIPQRWMDSTTQFPSATYTIKCRPPYGNVMSRFLNMHVPIACLLAAALPISYGRHSYGAPMLCEFYVPGKNQSRLAMITSLSITRGEGNLGWTKDGDFLGCDITFTVTDLSTVMHAPIDAGMDTFTNFRWIISDDNAFNDYLAALSNLSVAEMSYSWEKLKKNWNRYLVSQQNYFSASRISMVAADTTLGRAIRKMTPYQDVTTQ